MPLPGISEELLLEYLWVIPILLLGIPALVFGVRHLLERRRTSALRAVAEQAGYHFVRDGKRVFDMEIAVTFRMFRDVSGPVVRNLLSRQDEATAAIVFDFGHLIMTDVDGPRRRVWQTVAAQQWRRVFFPDFCLRPQRWFDRLLALGVDRDVALPHVPAFCKRYQVQGHAPAVLRDFLSADVIGVIQQHDDIIIEGGGQWLMMYRHRDRVSPDSIMPFQREAMEIGAAMVRRLTSVD